MSVSFLTDQERLRLSSSKQDAVSCVSDDNIIWRDNRTSPQRISLDKYLPVPTCSERHTQDTSDNFFVDLILTPSGPYLNTDLALFCPLLNTA